jgi:hypothetical protein
VAGFPSEEFWKAFISFSFVIIVTFGVYRRRLQEEQYHFSSPLRMGGRGTASQWDREVYDGIKAMRTESIPQELKALGVSARNVGAEALTFRYCHFLDFVKKRFGFDRASHRIVYPYTIAISRG